MDLEALGETSAAGSANKLCAGPWAAFGAPLDLLSGGKLADGILDPALSLYMPAFVASPTSKSIPGTECGIKAKRFARVGLLRAGTELGRNDAARPTGSGVSADRSIALTAGARGTAYSADNLREPGECQTATLQRLITPTG